VNWKPSFFGFLVAILVISWRVENGDAHFSVFVYCIPINHTRKADVSSGRAKKVTEARGSTLLLRSVAMDVSGVLLGWYTAFVAHKWLVSGGGRKNLDGSNRHDAHSFVNLSFGGISG
jgi:hypothetical protein